MQTSHCRLVIMYLHAFVHAPRSFDWYWIEKADIWSPFIAKGLCVIYLLRSS